MGTWHSPATAHRSPLSPFILALVLCTWPTLSWGQESHSSGWVVIPVEDYRALRAKAFPVEPEPDPPPVQAALTRVAAAAEWCGGPQFFFAMKMRAVRCPARTPPTCSYQGFPTSLT